MLNAYVVNNVWFYALGIPALLLTSLSKGGFGLGLGVVAVPLMALVLPVPQVVTILLPMLCITDLIALWQYRGKWSWPLLRLAIPAALVGIGIGTLAIHHLDEAWLRLAVGLISVDFVRRRWWSPRRIALDTAPHNEAAPRVRPVSCLFWGATSGFTSFMANAGEPALTMYLLPFRLSNSRFAGTTAAFFAVVNLTKLMSFSMLGLFTRTTLLTSLLLTPIAVLGTYAGIRLNRRLNATLFHQLSCAILLVIGVRLIYTSLKVIV
ncbi:sulfite exporter TauE/SafE family protein [Paraburkholderia rhizosphaerae]|uniref:Probable membrane transporter protein n=1 Tax=Paraburkholderia rhizosphaerae TaxID=480658 RepID=A0A4R8LJ67_9BURK|nr:sulfite exporter TauE/SafE family protein [Paraburkholderia rhizosphaerae]TDY43835.1 hypothetical protein BX592_11736 [Paraburkholderia rhizosphaerae]